jgi:anti-sigma B factor antagonist
VPDRSEIHNGRPATPPGFLIAVERAGDAVRVAPRGELDLATVEKFRRGLGEVIEAGSTKIVIDLRGVDFLDSAGLHALFDIHADAQHDSWELSIIPGPPALERIFELTQAIDHLPFTTTNGTTRRPLSIDPDRFPPTTTERHIRSEAKHSLTKGSTAKSSTTGEPAPSW